MKPLFSFLRRFFFLYCNCLFLQRLLKDKEDLPANRVKPAELLWILDQAAAAQL